MAKRFGMTKAQPSINQLAHVAYTHLQVRYAQICERYPLTRDTVTEKMYIHANLAAAIRNERNRLASLPKAEVA